jgi:DNA-binding GntR family transcriptional regulator
VLEKESGFSIDEVVQEVRALGMPLHVANTFGLPEASMSLQLMRHYMTRAGTLIASVNWHRGDQFTYKMQISRSVARENI